MGSLPHVGAFEVFFTLVKRTLQGTRLQRTTLIAPR